MTDSVIDRLMQGLRILPGVGPRTAQRMAFYLLQRNTDGARELHRLLGDALEAARLCARCRMLCETELCSVCASDRRDAEVLCVVQSPTDQWNIEQLQQYSGRYFVLHGCLSPMERIGPDEIGVPLLRALLERSPPSEVILALSYTLEGETTASYLQELLSDSGATVSRLSRGVPQGGELEYVDRQTLAQALRERRAL